MAGGYRNGAHSSARFFLMWQVTLFLSGINHRHISKNDLPVARPCYWRSIVGPQIGCGAQVFIPRPHLGKFAVTGIFASPKGHCKDTVILSTFASFSNNFLQKKCIRLSANRFLYQLVTARLRLAFLLRYGAKLCQNFRHLQVLGEVYFSMADCNFITHMG